MGQNLSPQIVHSFNFITMRFILYLSILVLTTVSSFARRANVTATNTTVPFKNDLNRYLTIDQGILPTSIQGINITADMVSDILTLSGTFSNLTSCVPAETFFGCVKSVYHGPGCSASYDVNCFCNTIPEVIDCFSDSGTCSPEQFKQGILTVSQTSSNLCNKLQPEGGTASILRMSALTLAIINTAYFILL